MTIPDFPSNNQDTPDEPKRDVKRVTKGRVVRQRKKSSAFRDSVEDITNYVIKDVMGPRIRDMIVDSINGGVERAAYGETRSRPRATRPGGARSGHISYNRYASPSTPASPPKRTISRTERATHDFDNIILETRDEANEVIDRMYDMLSEYGFVAVSDLYSLLGIDSNHTDTEWGWTNLNGAHARRIRAGWLLDIPATEYIK